MVLTPESQAVQPTTVMDRKQQRELEAQRCGAMKGRQDDCRESRKTSIMMSTCTRTHTDSAAGEVRLEITVDGVDVSRLLLSKRKVHVLVDIGL